MRILILITSLFMTSYALSDPTTIPVPTAPPSTTQAQITNGMLTSAHPSYTLHLNSNATTGYRWLLVSYPKNLVTLTGHQYVAPKVGLVGAPGYEEWTFQAQPEAFQAPRLIEIKMMYAQPWNISSQTLIQTFYLTTDSAGKA